MKNIIKQPGKLYIDLLNKKNKIIVTLRYSEINKKYADHLKKTFGEPYLISAVSKYPPFNRSDWTNISIDSQDYYIKPHFTIKARSFIKKFNTQG